MTNLDSDAFVFFGATGDLAFKQIFPALQAMIRHGHLNMPIIGVARSAKGLDGLRARARESLEKHGGVDPQAFAALSAKLQYVNGEYSSPETFRELRKALGSASRPLYYLAIPPDLFETVAQGLAKARYLYSPRFSVDRYCTPCRYRASCNHFIRAQRYRASWRLFVDPYHGDEKGHRTGIRSPQRLRHFCRYLQAFWQTQRVHRRQDRDGLDPLVL